MEFQEGQMADEKGISLMVERQIWESTCTTQRLTRFMPSPCGWEVGNAGCAKVFAGSVLLPLPLYYC